MSLRFSFRLPAIASLVVAGALFYGCDTPPSAPVSSDDGVDVLARGCAGSGGGYSRGGSYSRGGRKSGGSYGGSSGGSCGGKSGGTSGGSYGGRKGGYCGGTSGGGSGTDTGGYSGNPGGSTGGNCDTVPVYDGCVHSVKYWQDNPESWPFPYQADLQFCTVTGATFYGIFTMDETDNWYLMLAHEYIAGLLNKTYNGGNIPPEIQAAIDEAQLFFNNRDGRIPLTADETAQAQRLYEIFSWFNRGGFYLPSCD